MRSSGSMSKTAFSCVVWLSVCLAISASDPDPLQDFCVANMTEGCVYANGFPCKDPGAVNASDFLFRGLRNTLSTNNGLGFRVRVANVENFPGLNTLGISMTRAEFAPGGVHTPHYHRRASEIIFVKEGTLLVGFIAANNVLFLQQLETGDVFVIPKGLVHFEINMAASCAATLTALNSQLPGVQMIGASLFESNPAIPEHVLAKALNISTEQVKDLVSKRQATPTVH